MSMMLSAERHRLTKSMKNQTGFSTLVVIAIVIAVGVAVYFGFVRKLDTQIVVSPSPFSIACAKDAKQCPDGSAVGRTGPKCEFVPCPTSTPKDETAGWKTYTNIKYGFEFKYNPIWSIAPINTGSGYDASKPFVLVWAGTTSDTPCDDFGCPPKSGDRDELTKGDTLQGAPLLNPWFKILRVRGNKWVSIQVTDVNKNCSSEATCQQYLSVALLAQKVKVSIAGYQTYNNFIDLLDTFKFT